MGTINVPTQEQRDARLMQLAAKKLAAKKHPDEVADLLCKTGDIYWNEAIEIVDEVRYNRRGMIAMYQLPSAIIKSVLYAALGVFLLLLGGARADHLWLAHPVSGPASECAGGGRGELLRGQCNAPHAQSDLCGSGCVLPAVGGVGHRATPADHPAFARPE